MRLLILILIGLGIGGAMLYFFSENQLTMKDTVEVQQNEAKDAADEYKKQQMEMMLQIQN